MSAASPFHTSCLMTMILRDRPYHPGGLDFGPSRVEASPRHQQGAPVSILGRLGLEPLAPMIPLLELAATTSYATKHRVATRQLPRPRVATRPSRDSPS